MLLPTGLLEIFANKLDYLLAGCIILKDQGFPSSKIKILTYWAVLPDQSSEIQATSFNRSFVRLRFERVLLNLALSKQNKKEVYINSIDCVV